MERSRYRIPMIICTVVAFAMAIFFIALMNAFFRSEGVVTDAYYYFDFDNVHGRYEKATAIAALESIGVLDGLCSGFEIFAMKSTPYFLLPGLAALIFLIMGANRLFSGGADNEEDEEELDDEEFDDECDGDDDDFVSLCRKTVGKIRDSVASCCEFIKKINISECFANLWNRFRSGCADETDKKRHTVEINVTPKTFCPGCDAELTPGAHFCKRCGRKIDR